MARLPLPTDTLIRGRDLTPLLEGLRPEWNNDLFAEYRQHPFEQSQQYAYRTPEWKLVRDLSNPTKDELYDLTSDPDENLNLIASQDPHVVENKQHLQKKLEVSLRSIDQHRHQ